MKKIFYLLANLLAGFMDFGLGMLIAVVLAILLRYPLMGWEPFLAGALFNLLPDYDIVPFILRQGFTGKVFNFDHHQTVMHWPAVLLPVITLGMWLAFGPYWAALAFACILAHYLHDAYFMTNGIAWIFRFKKNMVTYPRHKHAPQEPDPWIKSYWLRPSPLSLAEVAIGTVCASGALAILAQDTGLGMLAFAVLWAGVLAFWQLSKIFKFA